MKLISKDFRREHTLMAEPSLASATASWSWRSSEYTFFSNFLRPLLILPSTDAVAAAQVSGRGGEERYF